jgi:threonine dehydratase
MTGVSSALCGTPLAARTRPTASLRSSRRVKNNNARRVVRCAVQEPEEDILALAERAARGCDPSNKDECIITPRQIVNGLELPSFEDVSTAHFRIRSGVVRTRCTQSRTLSALTGMNIYLKHEWEQATGSFKERGARNALLALSDEQKRLGVVAASAGNHALALAYHGRELGIPVTVLMPSIAPLTKITKCRALEANVVLEGDTIADAALAAKSYVDNDGMKYINGFDDFNIIAGAGSVGLEILEDAKDIDAIVVPVGGGGLIAGLALAVKTINPKVQIIGVEPDRCPSMAAAMAAGEVVKVPTSPTLADGLAVPTVGPRSFEVLRPRVDKLVTVSEQDISVALLRLVETEKLVQEGAGAAGIAACLAGKLPELEGKNVAVLLCGGNIDTSTLGNVLERGLVNDGRLIRFSAVVPDRPGGIAGLCAVIAFVGASIKQIVHERAWLQEDSHAVQVDVTCELTGLEMKETLYKALSEKYAVDFSLSKSNLNMNMVGKDSAGMMAAESKNGADAKTYSFDKNAETKPGRLPAPVLYDYDTIINNVKPSAELVGAVEDAFSQLANGRVDVPLPMHIGVAETPEAGPGDCHIKGGYIEGAPTWTVKLANVSFYNNVKKGLPAGSGVFVVCDATNGGPKAVLHENRYLTDLRTGAAGAVAVKHLAVKGAKSVAFIGTGVIAESMARSTATVYGFEQGYGYSRDMSKNSAFCDKMSAELGYAFTPCSSAEDAVRNADVVFTQTPGGEWVLDLKWLKPHALIIASGSDQPTKNEIPPAVMKKARVVTDITAQCLRVGELRSAVEAGVMKETDVHAQLGEVINGSKKGRTGKELIVCDLTGTGAQDAAIGSYVMKVLD